MHLLFPALLAALAATAPSPRFAAAALDDAWAVLPREIPTLPAWARVLVKPLPRTTGAMLEQDRLHRAENPLGSALAAKLRWIAADAIGCEYARVTAAADFRRAGATSNQVKRLTHGEPALEDRALFTFARQVTKAAYTVTDEQFAELLKQFGPETMTAIVETLAFANFQYRIIMALGVRLEPEGPCPPVDVRLDARRRAEVQTPARPPWDQAIAVRPARRYDAPADWKDVSFAELEVRLAAQKARSPRIPVPDASRFADLPPDLKRQTDSIVWTKVTAGYQPVMTQSWFAGLREFQQEARLDPVFGRTIFWVVTRANDCFY